MTILYAHLLPERLEAEASRLDGVLTLPEPSEEPATRWLRKLAMQFVRISSGEEHLSDAIQIRNLPLFLR